VQLTDVYVFDWCVARNAQWPRGRHQRSDKWWRSTDDRETQC